MEVFPRKTEGVRRLLVLTADSVAASSPSWRAQGGKVQAESALSPDLSTLVQPWTSVDSWFASIFLSILCNPKFQYGIFLLWGTIHFMFNNIL